jgi:hypothetical protein
MNAPSERVYGRYGSRLCGNATRYRRTQDFEACGHTESKKDTRRGIDAPKILRPVGHTESKKDTEIRPPHGITTKSDLVFAQPRSFSTEPLHRPAEQLRQRSES